MNFPRGSRSATALTIAFIGGSIACAQSATALRALAFFPLQFLPDFSVWQPLSYLLVETTPLGVIFGCVIVYFLGTVLEIRWGMRRFLGRFALIGAGAALLTWATALLLPWWVAPAYPGGRVLTSALWVAFGLTFRRTQLGLWGLPISGYAFAGLGAAFTALNAAFYGIRAVVPEAWGIVLTVLIVHVLQSANPWTRLRSWQLQRSLDRKRTRLHVVGAKTGRDGKPYLN